jgi:hypothetical protein
MQRINDFSAGALGAMMMFGIGCAGVDDSQTNDGTELQDQSATREQEISTRLLPWRYRHRIPIGRGGADNSGVNTGGTSSSGASTGGMNAGGSSATTGGSTGIDGPSGTADCKVCATANACCDSVSGGPLCTFDAGTCESLEPVAQAAYINGCKTLITTVKQARSSVPSTCQ